VCALCFLLAKNYSVGLSIHKVKYQHLHHSCRLQVLSPVTLEPPPSSLRHRLDQEGSFKATRTHENVPELASRECFLTP
jgi:hypothetical protein